MNLLVIFGPPAVGKMTVGQEIEKATGMRMFHNHMTIDLVHKFFEFGTPSFEKLVRSFRIQILEEVAASDLPGIIFTMVYALDLEEDREFAAEIAEIFHKKGGKVWFLELEANQEVRLVRNRTENRLAHKPMKRNFENSDRNLVRFDEIYVMNSDENFTFEETHLKINSENLTARRNGGNRHRKAWVG